MLGPCASSSPSCWRRSGAPSATEPTSPPRTCSCATSWLGLTRPTRRKARLHTRDKLIWVLARRLRRDWRRHPVLVRPETVVRPVAVGHGNSVTRGGLVWLRCDGDSVGPLPAPLPAHRAAPLAGASGAGARMTPDSGAGGSAADAAVAMAAPDAVLTQASSTLGGATRRRGREHRDRASARAFFEHAIARRGMRPRVVITDQHAAYPRALRRRTWRADPPPDGPPPRSGRDDQGHRTVARADQGPPALDAGRAVRCHGAALARGDRGRASDPPWPSRGRWRGASGAP